MSQPIAIAVVAAENGLPTGLPAAGGPGPLLLKGLTASQSLTLAILPLNLLLLCDLIIL